LERRPIGHPSTPPPGGRGRTAAARRRPTTRTHPRRASRRGRGRAGPAFWGDRRGHVRPPASGLGLASSRTCSATDAMSSSDFLLLLYIYDYTSNNGHRWFGEGSTARLSPSSSSVRPSAFFVVHPRLSAIKLGRCLDPTSRIVMSSVLLLDVIELCCEHQWCRGGEKHKQKRSNSQSIVYRFFFLLFVLMSLLISYRTVSDCPAIKHTVDSTGFVKPAGRGWKMKRQNTYI
jgi:hypothetical protein